MDNIKISAMTLPDLDSISDILTCEFDDFWNYNLFKSELENKNSMYMRWKHSINVKNNMKKVSS